MVNKSERFLDNAEDAYNRRLSAVYLSNNIKGNHNSYLGISPYYHKLPTGEYSELNANGGNVLGIGRRRYEQLDQLFERCFD